MARLWKYFALYSAFFRASLTADLEYRANFATRILTDIFWYVAQVMSFELLFYYSPQIGGWNLVEMRIFLGVLFIADSFYMILFSNNLDFLSESVRKGNLDLLLTKPVNSQFMISLQRASTAHIGNLLLALAWFGWALSHHPSLVWWRMGWLLLTIPCGVAVFYSFRFLFSAMAVVFTRAENLQYLWYHMYRLGLRPDNIYPPAIKILVLTAIPVGLIASVPARLLLGTANPWLALWALFVAATCLWVSNVVWRLSLRHYTSASS